MVGGSVTRGGCVLALALVALIAPSLARAAAGHGPGRPAAQHAGHRGVQLRTRQHAASAVSPFSATASNTAALPGQLQFHGGPVMASNTVRAMYWVPAGYSLDSTWRTTVDTFLSNVESDSATTSNVFGVTSQYGVSYNARFAGSAIDTTPFPASGCSQGVGGGPCLTEAQIFDELQSFAAQQGWAGDPNAVSGANPQPATHPTHLFVVYLPPGVADCFDDTQGICSANSTDPYYCAYHTAWTDNQQTYVWMNMPWSWSDSGCQASKFPNERTADTAIDATSHEYIEALTDPYLNAWYDGSGNEIADKCQTTYGTALSTVTPNYNQAIGSGHYWLQLEYSNTLHDCYQVGAPVVSSFLPTAATPGQSVEIRGQNFFGPVVVRFNGIAATVQSVTPTVITAKVPFGEFYGKVAVTAIGGSAASAANFGYAKPQLDAFAPHDGLVGTTVTLTGANFTGVARVRFGSLSDPTFTVVDDGTITAHVPAGFSSGRVEVIGPGGTATTAENFEVTRVTAFTAAARAGTKVWLLGLGLGSAQTVDFPNHPGVPVTSAAPTEVQVVVPADATMGPLVLHTPNIGAGGIETRTFKAVPTISSFTPDGQTGSAVTITGANLGDATAVKFGTVSASFGPPDPSGTSITTHVPAGFTKGRITVLTPHGTVVSAGTFAVTKVTGIAPVAAPAGTLVTVYGQGLASATTVDFGSVSAVPIVSATAVRITVRVPAGATIGVLTVHTPNIDGTGSVSASQFKPSPRITGFTAAGYQVGDTVTAHGTNLLESGTYSARIGVHPVAGLVVVDAGTLTFQVPADAGTGALVFANAAGSTASATPVTVRPTIAGFTPGEAVAGTRVTLTGATFTGTRAVTFGGARASFAVSGGGAALVATVPAAAVDGPITVTNAGGSTETGSAFTVDPVLRSFTPASGTVGTTILVTGTGLKNVTRVDFGGGVSAAPVSTSATSLKVVVPAGATSGPLAAHTGTAQAAAGSSFSVTLSVTSFSQPFAAPGATITINGVGLSNVGAVKFGALPATISAQSGSSLRVIVPAITGDATVSVTKGAATVDAPQQFGLFSVTSPSPHAVTAGGTIRVTGTHLDGATAAFAGVDTPVALVAQGGAYTATVPVGFTGGTVAVADAYGDAVDVTFPLFAVSSYSASHAAPGESITIALAGGVDYSSSAVQVRFAGAGTVSATGGNGSAQVVVPAGATSGALQVEADGTSGWATGGSLTIDRASVVLNEVTGGKIELRATATGGLGDTTVVWRQAGTSHTIDLPVESVQAGDLVVVDTGFSGGELTIEVATPLGAEDGLALNAGGTPSAGFTADVAALEADGVWAGSGSFDWSTLAAGESVNRTGSDVPDDAAHWSIAAATIGS